MEKILFDTDIGNDIDDAVCLAYLLCQPRCELMGITTVTGEADKRAMMASAMCKTAGKDIPIYPGIEKPLLTINRQPFAPQSEMLVQWEYDKEFPQNEAIEYMRHIIKKHPNEITLLAVGPMTNIALLFASDPEIPGLLKRLVLMCGYFTKNIPYAGPAEWNAFCDPHATAIVYNAPVSDFLSIGLDVTCQVKMDIKEVHSNFLGNILKPVLSFSRVWFEKAKEITFHDPLAAVSIFDEDVCGYLKGNIEVELASQKLMGMTHWQADDIGKHRIAATVDKDRFFKEYFGIVNRI